MAHSLRLSPPAAALCFHGEGGSDLDGMTACTRIPLGYFSRLFGRGLLEAPAMAKGAEGGRGKQNGEMEVAAAVTRAGVPYWRQQFPPNVWGEKNCSHCPKFHIHPPPPGGEKPLPRYQGGKMDQSQNPNMNLRQCGDMCCRKRALAAQCAGALEGS